MRGPSALFEEGWNGDQIEKFFARPDVKLEAEELVKSFRDAEGLAARMKYGLKRQLGRFGTGATSVLAAALAGPIYARDKNGHILNDVSGKPVLMETGPTTTQVSAAKEILDRIGVTAEGKGGVQISDRAAVNVNLTFASAEEVKIQIEDDPTHETEEEKALSRERCRTAIDILSKKLPAMKERAAKALPSGAKKKKKKKTHVKKKKRVKKKAKAAT
jgi:hypothetical protein